MKKMVKKREQATELTVHADKNKIYILVTVSGIIYKANALCNQTEWAFLELKNSHVHSNGIHRSLKELLDENIGYGSIYEFNKVPELLEFLGKQYS